MEKAKAKSQAEAKAEKIQVGSLQSADFIKINYLCMQNTCKMPTIQIRDVPVSLHKRLLALAKAEGRSLNKQVLLMLQEAMSPEVHLMRERRKEVLKRIAAERSVKVQTSPAEMIRHIRDKG